MPGPRRHREGDVEFDAVTTGTGDQGESGLYSGERLAKDDELFEVLGTLDELSSWLGLVKASLRHGLESGYQDSFAVPDHIEKIQNDLYRIGAEAATSRRSPLFATLDPVGPEDLARLEGWEKAVMKSIPLPNDFIVPGITRLGAAIDIARTVCRRLERRFVAWARRAAPGDPVVSVALRYLNRLSDYLFVAARHYERS
jgi:cob(I)alamin adenosyltransferase